MASSFDTYATDDEKAAREAVRAYSATQRGLPEEERDSPEVQQAILAKAMKLNAAVDQRNVEDLASRLDTSPTKGVPLVAGVDPDFPRDLRAFQPVDQQALQLEGNSSALANAAAEKGIDVHTGAPERWRRASGLLDLNPEVQREALQWLAEQDYKDRGIVIPKDFPLLTQDDFTGRMAYYAPQEDGSFRTTLIDPYDLDAGDFSSMSGLGVSIGTETAGAIAGGLMGLPGGPKGVVASGAAGAAAGGAFGVKARVELAESMGIPSEIAQRMATDDEYAEQALMAGFGELALPGMVGAWRRLRNIGRVIPADDPMRATKLRMAAAEAKAAADKLQEELGAEFTLNAGILTKDPEILVRTKKIGQTQVGEPAMEQTVAHIHNRQESVNTLQHMFDQSIDGAHHTVRPPEQVSEEARRVLADPTTQSAAAVEEAQVLVDDVLERTLGREPDSDMYYRFIDDLQGADTVARNEEVVAWDDFRQLVGYNEKNKSSSIHIDNSGRSEIRKAIARIDAERRTQLSDSANESMTRLISDVGFAPDVNPLRTSKEVLEGTLAGDTIDPAHLHRLISDLKAEARRLDNSTSTTGWNARTVRELYTSLEDAVHKSKYIDTTTGKQIDQKTKQGIVNAWDSANQASATKNRIFEHKAIRGLLETQQGKDGQTFYVQGSDKVRQTLLKPGDKSGLEIARSAVGKNPEMDGRLLDEIDMMYQEQVVANGNWNPVAHTEFMQKYGDHIEVLSGNRSTAGIQNGRMFAEALDKAKKRHKRTEVALRDALGTELPEINGASVARAMFNRNTTTLTQAQNAAKRLKAHSPELWAEVQREGADVLFDLFTTKGGADISAESVQKVINENRGALATVFGDKYVSQLDSLHTLLRRFEEFDTAGGFKTPSQSLALQFTRTLFGPLSVTQRRLSAAQRLNTRQLARRQYRLMTDPNGVEALIRLPKLNPKEMLFWQTAGAAFGGNVDDLLESSPEAKEAFAEATARAAERTNRQREALATQKAGGTAFKREMRRRGIR